MPCVEQDRKTIVEGAANNVSPNLGNRRKTKLAVIIVLLIYALIEQDQQPTNFNDYQINDYFNVRADAYNTHIYTYIHI